MAQHDDSEAAVRALIERWADSVRAHDIDGVLAQHAPDILMFDVVGRTQLSGLQAYRESRTEQFFPWHGGNGRFALRELQVTAGDTVAFATALLDCAGTEDGRFVEYTLRLTIGLRRAPTGWVVAHEHHSEPVAVTAP